MESVEKKDSLTAPSEFATTASTDAANAPTTFPVEAPPLEEEEVIIEQDPRFCKRRRRGPLSTNRG